jgi:hypothetical protein
MREWRDIHQQLGDMTAELKKEVRGRNPAPFPKRRRSGQAS